MKKTVLFQNGDYRCLVFGRDPQKPDDIIDTNECLIVYGDRAFFLDPGGTEIFPAVLAAVSKEIDVGGIRDFFASHQDPDVMSSLPLWMGLCPDAKVHMPWLWAGFIAHFGHEYAASFEPIPDEGKALHLKGVAKDLLLVPAHYCHSSGNFSIFDPNSNILFSGDIGAGLVPPDAPLMVEDFASHIQYIEGFHGRWRPINRAKNDWVQRVRELNPGVLCPQHGSIYRGEQVGQFLDWFEELEVGVAIA